MNGSILIQAAVENLPVLLLHPEKAEVKAGYDPQAFFHFLENVPTE